MLQLNIYIYAFGSACLVEQHSLFSQQPTGYYVLCFMQGNILEHYHGYTLVKGLVYRKISFV